MVTYIPILIFFFIFMLIRLKENSSHASLNPGDRVVTKGGVHGTVLEVFEKTVLIRTGRDTTLTVGKNSIARVKDRRQG